MLDLIKKITPNFLKQKLKFVFKHTLYRSKRNTVLKFYDNHLLNLYKGSYLEDLVINDLLFEPELRKIFKSIIKPGDTVLDIGANVGLHTLYFSGLVGETGKVFAFEPVEYSLKRLNANKQLNRAHNIHIVNAAVAEVTGEVEINQFKESERDLGNNSLLMNEKLSLISDDRLEKKRVQAVTLDNFCQKHRLKVDVIKMDIEGYEYFALKGARELIKLAPIMVLEYVSPRLDFLGITNDQFKELLSDFYDCYEVLPGNHLEDFEALEPFNFDRKISSNLLCLPKMSPV